MKLLLVRHGHVEGISPPTFRGQNDLPLTALGKRQADLLASRITAHWTPSAIYASPLQRTTATAETIALATNLRVVPTPGFLDMNYGDWQGRAWDAVALSDPQEFALWRVAPQLAVVPNGETLQDLAARATRTLGELARRHPKQTIVVVSHDAVNRVLLLHLLDQSLSHFWLLEQSPCNINEVHLSDGAVSVKTVNDFSHLAGL